MTRWTTRQIPDQSGKVALITGANAGLGLGTATELAKKGAEILMAVRSTSKGEQARQLILKQVPQAKVSILPLDLADLESVAALGKELRQRQQPLDLLINNAGVMFLPKRQESAQGHEMHWATNHLGHFALTHELLPLLEAAPAGRIVTVSSLAAKMGPADIYYDDIHFEQKYDYVAAYAQSKLANAIFFSELNERLRAAGSKVISVGAHPGYTATDLQRHMGLLGIVSNTLFAQRIDMGILPTLRSATDLGVKGGDYFGPANFANFRGYPKPNRLPKPAADQQQRSKLWTLTELQTGIAFLNHG
ncbi:oxidoreductase [Ferrimonas sp. YFM]|uniref:oxidoreductase n=1 Tax=Ferrimonas sp. YFM TaxID=3028878 RepID=UPI0025744111|nr:oxidoreductase [Ferrimonas sp. YFM]BDY05768.1 short-chain dehydrogenase [Ferrimonas sp. YFM]